MNNNLYQWHDQRMVDFEMSEIRRELGQANLFQEVGPRKVNWLTRAFDAFRSLLADRSRNGRIHRSMKPRAYQSGSDKAAP